MLRQILLMAIAFLSGAIYIFVSQAKRILNVLRFWNWTRAGFEKKLRDASTYDEYVDAAMKLDGVLGIDRWKRDPYSRLYDTTGVLARMYALKVARLSDDWEARLLLIRENLYRDVCGIGHPWLYTRCAVGTKKLIEEYVDEMALQIEQVVQAGSSRSAGVDEQVANLKRTEQYLADCRQAYGRTALVFSGGVSLGMYHLGVVKGLVKQNCLPSIICGTSIGALVAAMLGICTDEELPQLWNDADGNVVNIDFSDFETETEAGPAWARKLRRLLKHGVLMDVRKLAKFCRHVLGDLTFQEAYQRTGRVVNITVPSNSKVDGGTTLLNHITTPNVVMWSAACASCEYPGLYTKFDLLCKGIDGVIQPLYSKAYVASHDATRQHDDLPMRRLSELFNVNHFIVSQVQPHIIPFLRARKSRSKFSRVHQLFMYLLREMQHIGSQIAHFYICPSVLKWIIAELENVNKGHITIVPSLSVESFAIMLSNPDDNMFKFCLKEGEKAVFAQVSEIHTRCRVEFALRDATLNIRKRISDVGSESPD